MARVAVLDDWQGVAERSADWTALKSRAEVTFFKNPIGDENALAGELSDYDAIIAMRERTRFSAALIARLPKLRLLAFTGARNASVDTDACSAHGIAVCNTGSKRNSASTAEIALTLMLAAARGLAHGDAEIRAGRFQENTHPGIEMKDRTLGLIGLGKIGGQMAGFGRALGMTVIAWSQNLTPERAAEAGAALVTKEELFARADIASVHLVLSARSQGIVGAAEIARMKPGAILVNTSRAPLIDKAALLAALHAGKIMAALDVFDVEPLPANDPLRTAPNTVLTPHFGYVTQENMSELYGESVENVMRWLDGDPVRVINAGALQKAAAQ